MGDQQLVPGLSISPSGEATVAPYLADVLFDPALKLDEMDIASLKQSSLVAFVTEVQE